MFMKLRFGSRSKKFKNHWLKTTWRAACGPRVEQHWPTYNHGRILEEAKFTVQQGSQTQIAPWATWELSR